jgi:hypothetical protein
MIDLIGTLRKLAAVAETMRGTDDATLQATWTDAMATALANYTAARAGYIDELAAANLPTDISTIDTVVDGIQDDLDNGTDGLGALKTLIDAITAAGPTNTQMETARDAIITEVDANETKIDDLDGDLVAHNTALTNHNTALTNHNTTLTNHESSQSTHRAVLVDIHDTDLPAVKTVADAIAVLTDTKVMGRTQIVVHNDDLDSTGVGTYSLIAAVDQDVIIESLVAYCTRDLSSDAGFTGLSVQTDDATNFVFISQAEGVKANLTAESQLSWTGSMLLKVGSYIDFSVYGGAVASVTSLWDLIITYRAVVSGGYIA